MSNSPTLHVHPWLTRAGWLVTPALLTVGRLPVEHPEHLAMAIVAAVLAGASAHRLSSRIALGGVFGLVAAVGLLGHGLVPGAAFAVSAGVGVGALVGHLDRGRRPTLAELGGLVLGAAVVGVIGAVAPRRVLEVVVAAALGLVSWGALIVGARTERAGITRWVPLAWAVFLTVIAVGMGALRSMAP